MALQMTTHKEEHTRSQTKNMKSKVKTTYNQLLQTFKMDRYIKQLVDSLEQILVVEDKLSSSQQLDFIRSEGELECSTFYGFHEVLCTCPESVKNCMGESGWLTCVGVLGWFKWVGMLG